MRKSQLHTRPSTGPRVRPPGQGSLQLLWCVCACVGLQVSTVGTPPSLCLCSRGLDWPHPAPLSLAGALVLVFKCLTHQLSHLRNGIIFNTFLTALIVRVR